MCGEYLHVWAGGSDKWPAVPPASWGRPAGPSPSISATQCRPVPHNPTLLASLRGPDTGRKCLVPEERSAIWRGRMKIDGVYMRGWLTWGSPGPVCHGRPDKWGVPAFYPQNTARSRVPRRRVGSRGSGGVHGPGHTTAGLLIKWQRCCLAEEQSAPSYLLRIPKYCITK